MAVDNSDTSTLDFLSTLRFHQSLKTVLQEEATPIYQNRQAPYDFYISLDLKGDEHLLSFYQFIANLGQPIVSIRHSQLLPIECPFWQILLGNPKTENQKVRLYMSYYNFTLYDWILSKQEKEILVSQQEIFYILKVLLPLAIKFTRIFNASANVFQSKTIFLTNKRNIVLYPTSFTYQQSFYQTVISESLQKTLETYQPQINKNEISEKKISFNSTLQSSRACPNQLQKSPEADLISLLLLVMQLLTFKPKAYFYDLKHRMIKRDLLMHYLQNKKYTGHLQPQFLGVFEKVVKGNINSCQELMQNLMSSYNQQKLIYRLGKACQSQHTSQKHNLLDQVSEQRRKLASKTFCFGKISRIKKCVQFHNQQ